jgi:hypothetical protein
MVPQATTQVAKQLAPRQRRGMKSVAVGGHFGWRSNVYRASRGWRSFSSRGVKSEKNYSKLPRHDTAIDAIPE